MSRIVSEPEFRERLQSALMPYSGRFGAVTGPGRSGAVAAVYASHYLHIPFISYGTPMPERLGELLMIDTARDSGATLRKAASHYARSVTMMIAVFEEPPRVVFWYEALGTERGVP